MCSKCRCDCKYLAIGIFQRQLDIAKQILIIWTILINKYITSSVFTLEISFLAENKLV